MTKVSVSSTSMAAAVKSAPVVNHGAEKRPGGRSSRVKSAVLDAVIVILAEKGAGACSIESIAERSGVHKTTIYRRWGGLGEVMKAAFAHMEASPDYLPDTGSLASDVLSLIKAYAQYFDSPQGRAINQVVAGSNEQDGFGLWMKEYYESRIDDFYRIAERAIQRREINSRSRFMFCMEMVMGTMLVRTLMTRGQLDNNTITELHRLALLYLSDA